jgi:hypothetical protein
VRSKLSKAARPAAVVVADPKRAQWLAMAARARKTTEVDFAEEARAPPHAQAACGAALSGGAAGQVERRVAAIPALLAAVAAFGSVPATAAGPARTSSAEALAELRALVEGVEGLSQWFCGGTRELREKHPELPPLEAKAEAMVRHGPPCKGQRAARASRPLAEPPTPSRGRSPCSA